jgi:delta 1-pyrroline-5-carboxylate dehydrogenase
MTRDAVVCLSPLRATIASFLVTGMMCVVGCRPAVPPGAITVDGTLSLAGQPIPKGVVQFIENDGRMAGTARITAGRFRVVVKPGAYNVAVSSQEELYDAQGNSAGFKSLLPEKYASVKTSGLSATVDDGHRTVTFDLAR